MRGDNGAPADSGGGGDSCKSTSDMCKNDTRNMNNTRDNEDDEVNNNLRLFRAESGKQKRVNRRPRRSARNRIYRRITSPTYYLTT